MKVQEVQVIGVKRVGQASREKPQIAYFSDHEAVWVLREKVKHAGPNTSTEQIVTR